MELVLVMAAATILLMVLAFLSLTRDDRELAREDFSLGGEARGSDERLLST